MSTLPGSAVTALLSIRLGASPLDGVLDTLVMIAKDALDGIDEVSITLVNAEKQWTAAYSGPLALDADELQYDRGYGPCIDAGVSGSVLHVPDMRVEKRWPDYAAVVVARGVLSSLSVPLPVQTDLVGALNCYSRTPGTAVQALDQAGELAAHVAVAIANAHTHAQTALDAENMRMAMQSRAVIEQAKGVIMGQNKCDADAAFMILRRASMGRNVKLRDVAADIVERVSGTRPD